MSSFADSRLSDAPTWDEVKSVYGLRAPTITKLQANDPHTADGAGVWNAAGIITTDARQLWQALSHEEPTDDSANDADHADIAVDQGKTVK